MNEIADSNLIEQTKRISIKLQFFIIKTWQQCANGKPIPKHNKCVLLSEVLTGFLKKTHMRA